MSAGWMEEWLASDCGLPLSLPLCEGDQRDVYAPTLSHQPPPFYAQQLLPFASVYICRHLLCGGIVVQVTAVHLIREMFMPGLLGGLHCLQCLQYNPPYSATSPPGCWSSFTSSFQTVSTAVIITQSGHLQMHKLREHAENTHFTSLAKRTLDLDVIFFTLNGRIVAGFSCRI